MDLSSIEKQRQALEVQVQKLKDSLKHWQTWDLEYEGLKEEVESLGEPTEQQLITLSGSYDGTLVNEKEVRDLTGLTTKTPRKNQQIIDLINRRVEYVTKNIETISRQFYAAENKLEEFTFAESAASGVDPRFDDEPDLPFIEIHEELDEDGNVVSSELRRPEDETRKILDNLNKIDPKLTETDSEGDEISGKRPPIRKKSVSFSADTKAATEPARSESQEGRKSVSFAPKVAVAPAADPPDTRSVSFAANIEEIPSPESLRKEAEKQKDLRASFKPGEKVYELEEDATQEHVVLESEEDAQLRREMLEYHMNEVGSVVAQIELDDDHSDFTGSEYQDGDTPYTSETDDEDEDVHGRSRRREISDAYHEQMKALQARLIGNVGAQPSEEDLDDVDIDPKDVHKLVIRGNRSSMSSAASSGSDGEKKSKKRVSFAEAIDVAEQPAKVQKTEGHNFDGVLADSLVERDTTEAPKPEDDEVMARRQLAAEYYRRRNDMIKQQGGFKGDDDEEEVGELMEERDGKLKKVSRFKAARLSKD